MEHRSSKGKQNRVVECHCLYQHHHHLIHHHHQHHLEKQKWVRWMICPISRQETEESEELVEKKEEEEEEEMLRSESIETNTTTNTTNTANTTTNTAESEWGSCRSEAWHCFSSNMEVCSQFSVLTVKTTIDLCLQCQLSNVQCPMCILLIKYLSVISNTYITSLQQYIFILYLVSCFLYLLSFIFYLVSLDLCTGGCPQSPSAE